ncbi:MAG: PAS domain S-box protein [Deltaproteobacteria bacterium]|nr:PAS domain S-box protein [Deltaproteobacteria bacterium]
MIDNRSKEELLKEIGLLRGRINILESGCAENASDINSCLIFESAMDGMFVIDTEGRYVAVNSAGCRMFGYEKEEFLKSDISLILFPEDVERSFELGKISWKTGEFLPEYRMRKKDGSEIWVEMTIKPIKVNSNEYALGIKRDITERKYAQAELSKESEELGRSIEEKTASLKRANEALELQVKERMRAEEVLQNMLEGTSNFTGEEFLRSLVRSLALTLKFRYALVAEFIEEEQVKALSLAFWADGNFIENRESGIVDTPCEYVRGGTFCFYPQNLRDVFPKAELLKQMKSESYVGVPLLDEHGAPIGMLVAMDDKPMREEMTTRMVMKLFGVRAALELRRKKAEDELRKSEERLKEAQEIAHLGNWDWDIANNQLYWSDEIYRIFGLKPQEFGANYEAFVNRILPEDRDIVNKAVGDALFFKKPYEIDHRIVQPDGVERIVHEKGRVILDSEGKAVRMLGTVQDITESKIAEELLRESEKKFRNLIENIPLGISITTEDGVFIEANPALWKMFGYDSKEEFMGLKVPALYRDPAERQHTVNEIKKGKKDIEIKVRRKDGTEFVGSLTGILQNDGEGKGLIISIVQDITERKKIDSELLKAQKLESIGVLAGGMAHDFNNILLGILGNISVAKLYSKPGERISGILDDVEKSAVRAKSLTRQLLTFSQGGDPIKESAPIEQLVKDAALLTMRGSKISCDFSFPKGLWAVEVDEGQMNQVISNIVLNANHAMPDGGTIKITAENLAVTQEDALPIKPGDYVRIAINDTGTGIDRKILNKIFDPFFTTKQKASGLGLAVCYSIIKKHNGHIKVETKHGKGSTFYIYIPSSQEKAEANDEAVIPGKGRILVMDDEELVRDVSGEMLEILGYEPVFAKEGMEAVRLYKKAKEEGKPFSAVILDLTVPGGMGGRDTMQMLLELDPAVNAIVSSGYSRDPIMADYRKFGFKGVIAKPYRVSEFSKVVSGVLTEEK